MAAEIVDTPDIWWKRCRAAPLMDPTYLHLFTLLKISTNVCIVTINNASQKAKLPVIESSIPRSSRLELTAKAGPGIMKGLCIRHGRRV